MKQYIRELNKNDNSLIKQMQTGFEEDYVLREFSNLLDHGDTLYGLFVDDNIACVSGFSVTKSYYAMLGRLRSDKRYRGRGYATILINHIITEAFKHPLINWVGANTEEDNLPARYVLQNNGLTPLTSLYGAVTGETAPLKTGGKPWTQISDIDRKLAWLTQVFIEPNLVFPYACYYPLPASPALFTQEIVQKWAFYENDDHTRMVILKPDRKKHQYLHVIYPWEDLAQQNGLWETILSEYTALNNQTTDTKTLIWKDLTPEQANALPNDHPFVLGSPWILHGFTRDQWKQLLEQTQPIDHTSAY